MNEYMIAFSSFYKAVYAQEKVQEKKIRATLKKTPPGLLKSCGYALFLKTDDIGGLEAFLEESLISNQGVFKVEQENGKSFYRMVTSLI